MLVLDAVSDLFRRDIYCVTHVDKECKSTWPGNLLNIAAAFCLCKTYVQGINDTCSDIAKHIAKTFLALKVREDAESSNLGTHFYDKIPVVLFID